jgi:hypothetical protein
MDETFDPRALGDVSGEVVVGALLPNADLSLL